MDGGGVATCRELVLDYVSDVTWRVNAEIGNDYKKVSISAQQDIIDTIQLYSCTSRFLARKFSWNACKLLLLRFKLFSYNEFTWCAWLLYGHCQGQSKLNHATVGRLRFQGNAACCVT